MEGGGGAKRRPADGPVLDFFVFFPARHRRCPGYRGRGYGVTQKEEVARNLRRPVAAAALRIRAVMQSAARLVRN